MAAGQIARALGAQLVLGTVGNEKNAASARSSGYDQIFPVNGFERAVMEETDRKGIDIVLDARGEPTRRQSLSVLAPFSRLVVFGDASGNPEHLISPHELWYSNKAVVGYNITSLRREWRWGASNPPPRCTPVLWPQQLQGPVVPSVGNGRPSAQSPSPRGCRFALEWLPGAVDSGGSPVPLEEEGVRRGFNASVS